MFEHVSFGLALGAGGARGLAHIGVLKALERAGIKVHCLAGSSIGALVGAAYAESGNAAELERRVMEFIRGREYSDSGLLLMKEAMAEKPESLSERLEMWLKRAYLQARFVSRPSVLDHRTYRKAIEHFIPDRNIEDLPLPFCAMGTDLRSGRPVLFQSGSLRDAVYASSAIPGLVAPLERDGLLIVDGGVLNMVPVLAARHLGADVVAASDVEKQVENQDGLSTAIEVLFRVEDVQNAYLRAWQLREAELVIRPQVGHIHWSDFQRASELILLGHDSLAEEIDAVRALAARRKTMWPWTTPRPVRPGREWIII